MSRMVTVLPEKGRRRPGFKRVSQARSPEEEKSPLGQRGSPGDLEYSGPKTSTSGIVIYLSSAHLPPRGTLDSVQIKYTQDTISPVV